MISYLDASAAMKLLVEESESAGLTTYLQSTPEQRLLVASWLLHTELHCAANRHPDDIDLESVGIVLDTVLLIDLTRGDLVTAGTLAGRLRSDDALHVAVALRVGADELVTYDNELLAAANAAGILTVRPRVEDTQQPSTPRLLNLYHRVNAARGSVDRPPAAGSPRSRPAGHRRAATAVSDPAWWTGPGRHRR